MTDTPARAREQAQPRDIKTLHRWIALILAHPRLSPITVKAAVAIAMHFNLKAGSCAVHYETIAKEIGANRRSVMRAVTALEATGLITVERSRGFRSNTFLLRFEAENGDTQMSLFDACDDAPNGDILDPPTVTYAVTHNELRREQRSKEGKNIYPAPAGGGGGKMAAGKEDSDEGFDDFWAAYPRKEGGKDGARIAWAKRVKSGVDPGVMIAGAERYAIERAGQPADQAQFTKYPETWLRKGCWLDEVCPAVGQTIDQDGNPVACPRREGKRSFSEALAARQALEAGHGLN